MLSVTRIRSSAECSMCAWKTSYVVESTNDDPLTLAHKSNNTMDPLLAQHIKSSHKAFSKLFEAGRNEGAVITDSDISSTSMFRGSFNVMHRELGQS